MTIVKRRRPPIHTQEVVGATVDNFATQAFGGRSRAWLDRPIDPTRPTWDVLSDVVEFLGGEGCPICNLDAVALELVDGDHTQGAATLIVDMNDRTRTGRVTWTRQLVTGVSGKQLYLYAPRAMRRLACLLAGDVVELALGKISVSRPKV